MFLLEWNKHLSAKRDVYLVPVYERSALNDRLGHWNSGVLALGVMGLLLRQLGFWCLLKQGGRSWRATVRHQVDKVRFRLGMVSMEANEDDVCDLQPSPTFRFQ